LQFSKSGDPAIEKNYSTDYVSPALSERKQEKLQEKLNSAPQPVVFEIIRDSRCSECGAEMERGAFLLMEAEQPLCLACAGFGDLEFLVAGDTASGVLALAISGACLFQRMEEAVPPGEDVGLANLMA
jgi:hypothetical protein